MAVCNTRLSVCWKRYFVVLLSFHVPIFILHCIAEYTHTWHPAHEDARPRSRVWAVAPYLSKLMRLLDSVERGVAQQNLHFRIFTRATPDPRLNLAGLPRGNQDDGIRHGMDPMMFAGGPTTQPV